MALTKNTAQAHLGKKARHSTRIERFARAVISGETEKTGRAVVTRATLSAEMSNPTGKGSEAQRFQPGVSGNPGGRTPTAWLREFLDAAHDKSEPGKSRRQAVATRLVELATGKESPPKDSIEAAKLLWSYDMGKPVESLEVEQKNGPRVLFYLPAKDGTTATANVEVASPESPAPGEPKNG